jgi:pyruvate/2-oxoglutarate dehydrogenase complex dihydrolipoamide dehydrogenase (E3) component
VILCEQGEKLGGALFYADGIDFKEGIASLHRVLERRAIRSGAEILLETRVDEALVREIAPDVLIAAVGSVPIVPKIAGADGAGVLKGSEIRKDTPAGRCVVVIGGGLVGCEIALHLSEVGHQVTVIEMREEIAAEANPLHRYGLLWRLRGNKNLRIETGLRCTEIRPDAVRAVDTENGEHVFEADTTILSAGMKADSAQIEALQGLVPEFYAIGDGKRARRILHAVTEGYDAAIDLSLPV